MTDAVKTDVEIPVTATSTVAVGDGSLAQLPKFATTPKRGSASRRKHTGPKVLYAYAVEHGGRVDLTPEVKAEFETRGLPTRRIHPSIYDLKKYFGVEVATERTGRVVTALIVKV